MRDPKKRITNQNENRIQKQLAGGQHALPATDDCIPWIPKRTADSDAGNVDVANQFYFVEH